MIELHGKTEVDKRQEIYNYYCKGQYCTMKIKDLAKIPLNTLIISLSSCGLNPKSVCLHGNKKNCGCNTCIRKLS